MIFDVLRLLHQYKLRVVAPTARRESSAFNASNIMRLMVSCVMRDAVDSGSRNFIVWFVSGHLLSSRLYFLWTP